MVGVQPVESQPAHAVAIGSVLGERGDVLVADLGEGIGLRPGHQDEGALGGARVRQDQLGVVGGDSLVGDDVHIQCARPPGLGAHASGVGLQALADGEDLARRERRRRQHDGVEVVGLLRAAGLDDGGRSGQRRDVGDLDAVDLPQGADRGAQSGNHPADVPAQRENHLDRMVRTSPQDIDRCRHGGRGSGRGRVPGISSGRALPRLSRLAGQPDARPGIAGAAVQRRALPRLSRLAGQPDARPGIAGAAVQRCALPRLSHLIGGDGVNRGLAPPRHVRLRRATGAVRRRARPRLGAPEARGALGRPALIGVLPVAGRGGHPPDARRGGRAPDRAAGGPGGLGRPLAGRRVGDDGLVRRMTGEWMTALAAGAMDRHRDVLEGDVQGRLRLVDGDLDGGHAREGQHGLADTGGEGLDETHRLPLDDGDDRPGDLGVVDGVLDRVGDGGDRGAALAQVEGDIGGEELALGAFEGEDAVVPAGGQARQPDLIGRGGGHRCSFQREAVRTASRLAGTSWTRTAQAPARATRAVVAAVAASRAIGSAAADSGRLRDRKRLREEPMRTGRPSSRRRRSVAARSCHDC